MYQPSSREVRLWAARASALLAEAVLAGEVFAVASSAPAQAAGIGLMVAGIAAGVYAWVLHRREMGEYKADETRWNRWIDDTLSHESLNWAVSTWSRRYKK
jgi:hypothetical protein